MTTDSDSAVLRGIGDRTAARCLGEKMDAGWPLLTAYWLRRIDPCWARA